MKFLAQTILHPKVTGAVAPSSKYLADLMVREARLSSGQVVVELGPGSGVFTEKILQTLPEDGAYVGIESNEAFVSYLADKLPEAAVHHGQAKEIKTVLAAGGHVNCDRIISGLPWVDFHTARQTSLLDTIYDSLAEGGLFLTFSYVPFHLLPRGRSFHASLKKTFSTVRKTKVILRNLPPAFVYVCEK